MKLALFLWIINLPISYGRRIKLMNRAGSKIEKRCRIRRKIFIDHPTRLVVGENSFINYFCHFHCGISGHITIGKNVFIGPDVKLCCVTHEIGMANQRAGEPASGDIEIKDGVWIGIGSIIMPGVTIGEGSIVASGAVVNKNVEPNTVVGGVPARIIRYLQTNDEKE